MMRRSIKVGSTTMWDLYGALCNENGIDERSDLDMFSDAELADCGIKIGHAKKILKMHKK